MMTVKLLEDNEELIQSSIGNIGWSSYELINGGDVEEADLYILFDSKFTDYYEKLREKKEDANPVFCPVLLIFREDTEISWEDLEKYSPKNEFKQNVIDEVVKTPVEDEIILRRTENLLKRRKRSIQLHRQETVLEEEHLEMMDEVEFLQDVQQVASVGGWEANIKTGTQRWTKELYDIHEVSYNYEPTIGEGIDFYHPEDREVIREAFEKATGRGEPYQLELRLVTAKGNLKWVEARGRPIYNEEGEITGVRGTLRDITERKEQEKETNKSRRRFEAVVDDPKILVFVLDTDGSVLEVNDRAIDLVDEGKDEVLGRPLYETPWWNGDPDQEEGLERDIALASTGEYVEFETRLFTSIGDLVVDAFLKPVTNEEGEVVSMVAQAHDITERKRQKRELVRKSLAVEEANEVIVVYDPEHGITYVNNSVEEVFGYSPDEVLGEGTDIFHPEPEFKWIEENLQKDLQREGNWSGELMGINKDGEKFPVEVSVTLLDDGKMIGKLRDISKRIAREKDLRRSNARLEALADSTPNGQLIIGKDREVLFYNEKFLEIWGIPRELAETRSDEEFLEYVTDSLKKPEDFLEKVEYLYRNPYEESEDVIRLEDDRWIKRYTAPVEGEDDNYYGRLWTFQDITKRKKHEQRLRETKERLNFTLEGTNRGVWDWNTCTGEVSINDQMEELVGMDPGEFRGTFQEFHKLIHPADQPRVKESLERSVESGGTFSEELRLIREDGEDKWLNLRGEPHTENGTVHVLGVATDITALKESERKYEKLTERVKDGYYALDENLAITYWNDRMEERQDLPAEEVVGENILEYFPNIRDTEVEETFRKAIDTREKTTCEYYYEPLDYWTYLQVYPDEEGISVLSTEITERKKQEKVLKETKNRFQTLFNSAPNGIVILNSFGEVMLWNDQAEEIFGYNQEEIAGESIDLIIPEIYENFAAGFREYVKETGGGLLEEETEFDARDRSGKTFPVEISMSAWETEGDVVATLVIQDITERKLRREEMRKMNSDLELINRILRHDIRNDVQIITARSEFLLEHVDEDMKEMIQDVLDHSNHIIDITDSLRKVMKSVLDSGPSEIQDMNIRPVLLGEESKFTGRNDVEIKLCDIPELEVKANDMLDSVFRNLLNNAAEHNDKEEPVIELDVEVEDEYVTVKIADNGPGIRDELKEQVFGRSRKGEGSSGTGFGMFLVNRLIGDYDGEVWIEDNEPEGTVVCVTLPRSNPVNSVTS
ncbi:MAG: PAS domain S-box protein [Halobacteria archaeon]